MLLGILENQFIKRLRENNSLGAGKTFLPIKT